MIAHSSAALWLALATSTHPLTARDMQSMDRLGSPVVSPDGRTVVFPVTTTDVDANKRTTHLWRVDPESSGAPAELTSGSGSESDPRYSPDGKFLFFISTRSGKPQVWKLALSGGEATAVTQEPLGVANLLVSPDGQTLAYTMDVFPDCADAACTEHRLETRAGSKQTGELFDSLFVRHWDTWSNGTRSHVFARPLSASADIDLMRGVSADAPSKPFGDAAELAFTPDSKSLVYSARDVGHEEAWSTNFDLFVAPLDGKGHARNLTASNLAWDTTPLFSPDGKSLAYLAMSRPGYESDQLHLMARAWPNGNPRPLAATWDRSPSELSWSRDGKTLWMTAEEHGRNKVFALDVSGASNPVAVTQEGAAHGPQPAGSRFDRIVYTRQTQSQPAELYSARADGQDERRLTHFNDARLAQIAMGAVQRLQFEGAHKDEVEGWVLKPPRFDASKKYPVVLIIHGGPQGSMLDEFHYRWNSQAFAARGYGVVVIDFHGSTGYGQAFTDAIRDDWGGAPFEDLKRGLAAALAQNPWMDGKNVCAAGASFGGWMIDWIAGMWPDRFKCLVSHDGNVDERAAYLATEELWFPEWEHRGTPWDNPAGYAKHNPADHIGAWKTPILFVHGGQDFRVVATEGLSAFTAAQRRGVPSELLYFPDENHWVQKPQNSIQWHDTVLGWIDRWTRAPERHASK